MTDETKKNEAKQEAPKIERVQKNGVTRPLDDSMTGKLWIIADRESARLGKPAPRKVVVDAYLAEVPGSVQATASTQYARWVKFHGISDVIKANRLKEAAEAEEAKKAAAAEAKAAKDAEKQRKADEKAAKAAQKKADAEAKKAAAEAVKNTEGEAAA